MRLRLALALLCLSLIPASSHAETLTFEDAGAGDEVPLTTYDGFTWTNTSVVIGSDFTAFPGIPQSVVSGTHSAINTDFGADSFSSTTLFSLDSGYFTSFDGSGVSLTVSGFAGGLLIGTQTFTITDESPTFITFDQTIFGQVNEVTFSNYSDALAFDDLTVNAIGTTPEPATFALLLTGLGFVGAEARRRWRS
jgi:hypothetical protein